MSNVASWFYENIQNKKKWKGEFRWNDTWGPVSFIQRLKEECDKAMVANKRVMKQDRVISWIPPMLNTVKLNMDGASKRV